MFVFSVFADLSDCDAQVLLCQLVDETNATGTATMVTNCIWAMQAAYDFKPRPRALARLLSFAQEMLLADNQTLFGTDNRYYSSTLLLFLFFSLSLSLSA